MTYPDACRLVMSHKTVLSLLYTEYYAWCNTQP